MFLFTSQIINKVTHFLTKQKNNENIQSNIRSIFGKKQHFADIYIG